MPHDFEHHFKCWLPTCLSSLVKWLCIYFAHFQIGLLSYYWILSAFYFSAGNWTRASHMLEKYLSMNCSSGPNVILIFWIKGLYQVYVLWLYSFSLFFLSSSSLSSSSSSSSSPPFSSWVSGMFGTSALVDWTHVEGTMRIVDSKGRNVVIPSESLSLHCAPRTP